MSITIHILKRYQTEEQSVAVSVPPSRKAIAEAEGRDINFSDIRVLGSTGTEIGNAVSSMFDELVAQNSGG